MILAQGVKNINKQINILDQHKADKLPYLIIKYKFYWLMMLHSDEIDNLNNFI